MEDAERLRRMYLVAIAQHEIDVFQLNIAVDAQLFSLGRKETLSTGLVTISGSLRVLQAVILMKPLNQFILHAQVCDSAILARLLGCCWRTGSNRRLLCLYRRTGSTMRFFFIIRIAMRKRRSCRKTWSFSSGGLLLPSASHVQPPILTQINDDDVCRHFYNAYVMTS